MQQRSRLLLFVLSCAAAVSAFGLSDSPDMDTWSPSSSVKSVVVTPDTIYIGGFFGELFPPSGASVPRNRLAALDADTGEPLPWAPEVQGGNQEVYSLALSGNTVYVAGNFESVSGQARRNLAAVAADTGALKNWNPDINGAVESICIAGSKLYLGGNFQFAGVQARESLAAVDINTGAILSWNPQADGAVRTLVHYNGTIYAGGSFQRIGGQIREHIAAINANTNSPLSWAPQADGDVYDMAISGTTLYVVGDFRNIAGQPRTGAAAFNLTNGALTSWNAGADAPIFAVAADATTVYLGGSGVPEQNEGLTMLGGQTRHLLGAVSATTGTATSWHPFTPATQSNQDVYDIQLAAGGKVYVGGNISNINGGRPSNLLKFGEAVTPDTTPPAATQVTPSISNLRLGDGIAFHVTFSEAVQGFNDANDLIITTSGPALTYSSPTVSGSGSEYTVLFEGLESSGGVLSVAVDTSSDVTDAAGNGLATTATGSARVSNFGVRLPVASWPLLMAMPLLALLVLRRRNARSCVIPA